MPPISILQVLQGEKARHNLPITENKSTEYLKFFAIICKLYLQTEIILNKWIVFIFYHHNVIIIININNIIKSFDVPRQCLDSM